MQIDWTSFFVGAAVGAGAIFFGGFGGAAGADAWNWTRDKLRPPPRLVRQDLRPPDIDCAWVVETDIPVRLDAGYKYYKQHRATCYRQTTRGREFLMIKPLG